MNSCLLIVFLGVKPLSIFGVLDGMGKGKLRDHFHKEYPLLKQEAFSDQGGLLTLLRDHVVDLEILNYEKPADTTNDTGAPVLPPIATTEHIALLPTSESAQGS